MSTAKLPVIDYRKANAVDLLLPNPAVLWSTGWGNLHLEVFQQPRFEVAEHQHTMHAIAYAPVATDCPMTSIGERWLDGRVCHETRHQGDIAIIPAGVSHRCNWQTSVQFMVLAIEPVLLHQMGQDIVNSDRIELMPQYMNAPDLLLQGIFSTLQAELEVGGIGGNLLIDSLKTTLAIHLLRHYCTIQCTPQPQQFSPATGLSRSTLQQVIEYIHASLHQDLQLVELAAIVQLSPYHFLRLFKQSMGITPHQYILQCRVERAQYLLQHSTLSIAEIAIQTGFSDQSHLTRCCKRKLGMTPKQLLRP